MIKQNPQSESGTTGFAVLRKQQVCQLLAISPATLDRKRAKGEFPAPIKLGEQAVGWTVRSIQDWLASQPLAHHFAEAIEVQS